MQEIIRITNGITRHPAHRMEEPVSLVINQGEQIAIVGENASGKSRLVDIITERYPLLMNEVKFDFTPSAKKLASENIKTINFRDTYGDTDSSYYYQQRWNQHDIDESTPTVEQLLRKAIQQVKDPNIDELREHLYDLFNFHDQLEKLVISLSSGELRKFQLIKTLLSNPRVLVLDNPFIGLDEETRKQLATLLGKLTSNGKLLVILVLSKTNEIPDFITHILPIDGLRLRPKIKREEYIQPVIPQPVLPVAEQEWILHLKSKDLTSLPFYPKHGETILKFNNVTIRYGQRTILKDLNWTVNEGERWALTGENGSGKSTLLSLVCADNPQAYACDIELFGHKRGSGESIWEIKRHIGYVSPEMHRAYQKDIPAIEIVASGLNDSVGLYCRPRPEQLSICLDWMRVFGICHLANRTFLQLSSGEQRLCLLSRAFVKDPELLILDEPLHGLDNINRARVKEIINTFCMRKHKTLVMVSHYKEEFPECIEHTLFLKKQK